MDNTVTHALNNLGMELIIKDEKDGIVFEIYRLRNCCLECYTYPKNEEYKKKFFASSNKPINHMDMLLYCQYSYKFTL